MNHTTTDPALLESDPYAVNRMEAPNYDASLRAYWLHRQGVVLAQFLILLTIMGARFLWERRGAERKFWSRAQWVVLLWIGVALLSRVWQPNYVGLSQRLLYFGFYFWMLLIVREIELGRRSAPETSGAGDANELDESGQVVQVP